MFARGSRNTCKDGERDSTSCYKSPKNTYYMKIIKYTLFMEGKIDGQLEVAYRKDRPWMPLEDIVNSYYQF